MSFSISDAKVHHFCDIAAFPTQNFFPFRKNVPIIKICSVLYNIIRYARKSVQHEAYLCMRNRKPSHDIQENEPERND